MLVPLPFEAKLSLPGLRRACSRSSRTPLTGVFAVPTSATGARSFFVSKGSVLYSDTLIALGGAAMRSVWPSGGALATKSVPMLPPEPVRFSTMTGWPSASPSRGASARAVKSVIPPGGKVTTSRIGLLGYWPSADAVDKFLQLAGHVVGRADEHDARLDQVLDRAVVRVDELAVARHRAALASRLDHARGVFHRKIAGWRAEGLGDDPRGAQIAGHDLGAAPGFLPVLGDRHQPEVGEPVGRRRGPAEIGAGLAVVVEQFLRLEAGEEGPEHVAALGDLADVLGAAACDPHRRVRLLVHARPDVDVAVLEMLALPVERAVDRGHRFNDEVVRLPEAVHLADRRAHRERHLVRHAAHQAHLQAPARDHVDHRELLGDAHRVEAVGDRVAEREEPRALRLPREDRERHRRDRAAAGRGRVVLVDHDVQAQLVGEHPLVEAVMVVLGHHAWIAVAAGKNHAQRLVLRRPGVGTGLLGKVVDPHAYTFQKYVLIAW